MAIDLQLLKAGNEAEWERAWRELHLWGLTRAMVSRTIGGRFPQYVEDVAAKALSELALKAIKRCRSIKTLVPLLLNIAWKRAVDFLRSWWGKHCATSTDKENNEGDKNAPTLGDREALLRFLEREAAEFGLERHELKPCLDMLVEKARLNALQEALLRELIAGGLSQQEFADKHRLNVKTIGRRKSDVLKKLSRFLGRSGILGKSPASRASDRVKTSRRKVRRRVRRRVRRKIARETESL